MCITNLTAVLPDLNFINCKQLTFFDTAILSTVRSYSY